MLKLSLHKENILENAIKPNKKIIKKQLLKIAGQFQ